MTSINFNAVRDSKKIVQEINKILIGKEFFSGLIALNDSISIILAQYEKDTAADSSKMENLISESIVSMLMMYLTESGISNSEDKAYFLKGILVKMFGRLFDPDEKISN